MKYSFVLLLALLFVQCHNAPRTDEEKSSAQTLVNAKKSSRLLAAELELDTAKPAIQRAWYQYDTEAHLPILASHSGFVVLADTSFKATGFVAVEERFLRYCSTILDTTISYHGADWVKPWKGLTTRQRRARLAREQASYARQADSLHTLNNQGSYRVWLLNNSADTIALATQDASLVCILQAQDSYKQWRPVQFWRFSGCGNSTIARYLLPKEPISFLARIPRYGNFKTTLRYKLAGTKQFYYSNEFAGRINYGAFKEGPRFQLDDDGLKRESRPLFKLDSLLRADYRGNIASPFRRGSKDIRLLPH